MPDPILVPVDLNERTSWGAPLATAFALAASSGASVTAMTVVPDVLAGLDWRYAVRGENRGSAEYDMRSLVRDAEKRLEEIVSTVAPAGAEVEIVARHGLVYEQILEVAKEIGAGQIVMAAHRPSVSGYLIGENTARVVRHAGCTVTVVR